MDRYETRIEANRQIRLLINHCTPDERMRLKKYLKPVPLPTPPRRRRGEPEHLGQILSRVMDNISKRCQKGVVL